MNRLSSRLQSSLLKFCSGLLLINPVNEIFFSMQLDESCLHHPFPAQDGKNTALNSHNNSRLVTTNTLEMVKTQLQHVGGGVLLIQNTLEMKKKVSHQQMATAANSLSA